MQVKNVTLYDLQRIINTAKPKRHVEVLSKKSLKNLRACLTGFMKYCVNNYYCDPLRGELYIPVGHPTVGKDILQPDEIRKLFEPSDLWYYNAFLTMLLCGLRPGELLGLKRSDVQGRILLVNRAINGSNEITPGKNKNAHRAVPMPELAYRIIQDTIKRNDELRLNTEWIFCGYNGEAGNQCALRRQWIKLKQEKGLSDRIKLYSLRHTFVSIVSAQSSISEGNLKQILGHSKSMDTFGVYGHRVDNELENTATLIDLTFNRYRNTM
jgi:integrase